MGTYIQVHECSHCEKSTVNPKPTCAGINSEPRGVIVNICQTWHTSAELREFSSRCARTNTSPWYHVYTDTWRRVLFIKMAALRPPQFLLHTNEFFLEIGNTKTNLCLLSYRPYVEMAAVAGLQNLKWVTIFSEWAKWTGAQNIS